MFGRNLEPTANDIIGALDWHDPMPFDVSRYGTATQERIIAVATPVLLRSIALAQSVREAENRAAVKYAASVCRHDWYTAPGVTRHRVCVLCGLGQSFLTADALLRAQRIADQGYDPSTPSLAPSGTD